MKAPAATPLTAFLAGFSLAAIEILLGSLKSRGIIPYDGDSKQLFPYVVLYFLGSVFVYVIGIRTISEGLRYRSEHATTATPPLRYFFPIWIRMLLWFIGGASGTVIIVSLQYLSK
jgi:hypothetical protein